MKESISTNVLQHMEDCDVCTFTICEMGLICCECSNEHRRPNDKIYIVYPRGLHVSGGYAICETCLNKFYETSYKFRLLETSKRKLLEKLSEFKDRISHDTI